MGVTSENWWALGWYQCFFIFGEFLQLGDKEKGLANPTKGFFGKNFKKSSYLEKKKSW